jgi:hypothetical protein
MTEMIFQNISVYNNPEYTKFCEVIETICDENPTNVYCISQKRTDGLQRCDDPNHPGYEFCN